MICTSYRAHVLSCLNSQNNEIVYVPKSIVMKLYLRCENRELCMYSKVDMRGDSILVQVCQIVTSLAKRLDAELC